jgi:hypothetical protein
VAKIEDLANLLAEVSQTSQWGDIFNSVLNNSRLVLYKTTSQLRSESAEHEEVASDS